MPSESKPPVAGKSLDRLVLGIDGGGTKTAALLARCTSPSDFEIIGRGHSGSANVMAVGFDTATTNLKSAIQAAWAKSGIAARAVDAAIFALAGASLTEVQEQISHWAIQQEIAQRPRFIHDAEAVLAAGTPEGIGVALVSGTGSVTMGRNIEGKTEVTGGWGYWFGDEGSAFAIGQAGLRAVTQAADGRGPTTQLTQVFLEQVQVTDPRGLLAALSQADGTRYAIAKLAKEVTHAAELGDEVAMQISKQAGEDLAKLVEATAMKLSLGSGFPLALAGGVLCGSEVVRTDFAQRLSELAIEPNSLEYVKEPSIGCLKVACEELG
ncbi:N-acetylglucosamine kinase [Adhaeretor mobilis]|uniref:BadF/BadG/BcrA/BcrD ATPase family protein n=1 Tax=Adhaeretor mobilis TaxID=1930276 RepID=A0A517MTP7_9BACT|nr:BadF/BadG/BcrA/BcrD ATPase family protein [Adhaeretor mobilis]QDS98265.1 BadF/BadG/BcrA/BcrD ATPase family protein [Adhaeretor mobilis]